MHEQVADAPPIVPGSIELPRLFDLIEGEDTLGFLRDHPFLLPLLVELRREVDAHFDPWTPVLLDLQTDPEEGDTAIFARIRSGFDLDESLWRWRQLVDDWWLDALRGSDMPMHVDVIGR